MKTGEMIKELTENPYKEFTSKVNPVLKTTVKYFTKYMEIRNTATDATIAELSMAVLNGEWEEVKKPVDFMTAVTQGKRIRVEHRLVDHTGIDDLITYTSLDCLIYTLGEEYDKEEVKDIILNGKWYIE